MESEADEVATTRKRLRIGYLTDKSPLDRGHWSGIIHYMYVALQVHAGDVEILSARLPAYLRVLWYFVHFYRKFFFERLGIMQSVLLSVAYGRYFRKLLQKHQCDVLFAPIGATEVAYLDTKLPIIYLSDTTFRAQEDFYYSRSEISWLTRWEGHFLQRRTIRKAQALLFPSEWAARSAVRLYGANPAKIHVIPLGANIDDAPVLADLRISTDFTTCSLLFVSVDWVRKGGKLAYDTFLALRARGVNATFTVIGCQPGPEFAHPDFHVIPFLSKKVPADLRRLEQYYRDADFYLMPTRAECYGIVYCEAAAFGLPVIATAVGGVTTLVQEGVNGYLLPLEAQADEYAALLDSLWSKPAEYEALRTSSRMRYEEVLNWQTWAKAVSKVMADEVQIQTG